VKLAAAASLSKSNPIAGGHPGGVDDGEAVNHPGYFKSRSHWRSSGVNCLRSSSGFRRSGIEAVQWLVGGAVFVVLPFTTGIFILR